TWIEKARPKPVRVALGSWVVVLEAAVDPSADRRSRAGPARALPIGRVHDRRGPAGRRRLRVGAPDRRGGGDPSGAAANRGPFRGDVRAAAGPSRTEEDLIVRSVTSCGALPGPPACRARRGPAAGTRGTRRRWARL